jgi:hypothetical protein
MIILKLLFYEDKGWRDCLGIEPSGDGTRLPRGFEVIGVKCFIVPLSPLMYYKIRNDILSCAVLLNFRHWAPNLAPIIRGKLI